MSPFLFISFLKGQKPHMMYSRFQLTLTQEKLKNCSLHYKNHPEFPVLHMSNSSYLESIPRGKKKKKGKQCEDKNPKLLCSCFPTKYIKPVIITTFISESQGLLSLEMYKQFIKLWCIQLYEITNSCKQHMNDNKRQRKISSVRK